MLKLAGGADRVDAPQEPSHPLAIVGRAEFRPLPAAARADKLVLVAGDNLADFIIETDDALGHGVRHRPLQVAGAARGDHL